MEKVKSICVMRELVRAIADLESQLQSLYGVTFNEAMTLCCIGADTPTASQIAQQTGLAPSNTSKVLRSVEEKGLIARSFGDNDKRQMRFALTERGVDTLQKIKCEEIAIPQLLQPLF